MLKKLAFLLRFLQCLVKAYISTTLYPLLKQKHNGTCRNKLEFPSNIVQASHHIQRVPLFFAQLPYDLDSLSSLKPTTTRQVVLLLQIHHQFCSSIMIQATKHFQMHPSPFYAKQPRTHYNGAHPTCKLSPCKMNYIQNSQLPSKLHV